MRFYKVKLLLNINLFEQYRLEFAQIIDLLGLKKSLHYN